MDLFISTLSSKYEVGYKIVIEALYKKFPMFRTQKSWRNFISVEHFNKTLARVFNLHIFKVYYYHRQAIHAAFFIETHLIFAGLTIPGNINRIWAFDTYTQGQIGCRVIIILIANKILIHIVSWLANELLIGFDIHVITWFMELLWRFLYCFMLTIISKYVVARLKSWYSGMFFEVN